MHTLSVTALILAGLSPALAGFNASRNDNVAIYWGQNSAQSKGVDPKGPAQDRLSTYCDDPSVDIVLLSFLVALNGTGGEPELNFANLGSARERSGNSTQCDNSTTPMTCPAIEEDIKYCQEKDVTVMLSIGGAASKEQGWKDEQDSIDAGLKVWQMFGPDQHIPGLIRPFGSAVVDGFDIAFEHAVSHVTAFGKAISNGTQEHMKEHGSQFWMSASPICELPNNTPAIDATLNQIKLDILFIQFYNNWPCDANGQQNFIQWNDFTVKKNYVFFAGLPGNEKAAPESGYIPPEELKRNFRKVKEMSQFRGAVLWDASQAWWNDNYQQKVKEELQS